MLLVLRECLNWGFMKNTGFFHIGQGQGLAWQTNRLARWVEKQVRMEKPRNQLFHTCKPLTFHQHEKIMKWSEFPMHSVPSGGPPCHWVCLMRGRLWHWCRWRKGTAKQGMLHKAWWFPNHCGSRNVRIIMNQRWVVSIGISVPSTVPSLKPVDTVDCQEKSEKSCDHHRKDGAEILGKQWDIHHQPWLVRQIYSICNRNRHSDFIKFPI